MSSINDALRSIFAKEHITSRDKLNRWCGVEGRVKLYEKIKRKALKHWESLENPEASTRAAYERILRGYSHYKAA